MEINHVCSCESEGAPLDQERGLQQGGRDQDPSGLRKPAGQAKAVAKSNF